MIPQDADDLDLLAADHVLGTLEAREAAEVSRALPTNAALRDAVARWAAQLAPLMTLVPPADPPPDLWHRIDSSLAVRPSAPVVPLRRPRLLQGWALGATAVAAGLAALLLVRPPQPERLMTVLLTARDQPAWLVETQGNALRLASLNPRVMEAGRVQELWVLPPGATAPTSLGVIPAEGRLTVAPANLRPQPGMLVEISLEPPGGSPTGRPTGPVLFIGRLTEAGGT